MLESSIEKKARARIRTCKDVEAVVLKGRRSYD
jgi:hypothetical protein